MATKKAAKKTPARVARPALTPEDPSPRTLEANPMLGKYNPDTIATAAAMVGSLPVMTVDAGLGAAVSDQVDRVRQAVAARTAAARRVQGVQARSDAVQVAEQTAIAAGDHEPVLRAPLTNAMQKPRADAVPPGYSPDITSPINVGMGRRPPGTGVAALEDLAPGQDISPCPAGGHATTPLPDKPGEAYSAL